MPSLSVKTKTLKQKGKSIEGLGRRVNSISSELRSIRYALDWDIRSEEQIDRNLRDLSDALEALSFALNQSGKFLDNCSREYEAAEDDIMRDMASLQSDPLNTGTYILGHRTYTVVDTVVDYLKWSAKIGLLGPGGFALSMLPDMDDLLSAKVTRIGTRTGGEAEKETEAYGEFSREGYLYKKEKEWKKNNSPNSGSGASNSSSSSGNGASSSSNSSNTGTSNSSNSSSVGEMFSIGTGKGTEVVWDGLMIEGENFDGFVKVGSAKSGIGIQMDGTGSIEGGVELGVAALQFGLSNVMYENDYVKMTDKLEIDILTAEASAKTELSLKDLDANVKAGIGAHLAEGKVSTVLDLAGILEIEASGTGSVGVGLEGKVGLDDGKVVAGAKGVLGIGGGFEVKIGLGDTAKEAIGSLFDSIGDIFDNNNEFIQSLG